MLFTRAESGLLACAPCTTGSTSSAAAVLQLAIAIAFRKTPRRLPSSSLRRMKSNAAGRKTSRSLRPHISAERPFDFSYFGLRTHCTRRSQ
ncbi:hypothetical protein PF010_g232 [Phytophthora fragariae]|uniref:Uncharacterized protein n=1 Tax=Phytophthora fragariae TaxID=53985 RepID=A0A6A3MK15_9STRA|nr:hypothetical protein PF011_g200 [Phytophthora fragariae]KAE9140376.1 hypothetical protein PF010_g232 [Phytophthora fragariae]KAE9256181.1 hypothetical protein PF004_g217 [Phytophthora fragariae]KAE9362327.1 hypothetical protein PF008_g161 [Phytophthora fragariae]